jgi:hypothetical protein
MGSKVEAAATSWTCAGCEVVVSYAAGSSVPKVPVGWAKDSGDMLCLKCRREVVIGDASNLDDSLSATEQRKAGQRAVAEFELRRDPDRRDAVIASSLGTARPLITQTRQALIATGDLPPKAE